MKAASPSTTLPPTQMLAANSLTASIPMAPITQRNIHGPHEVSPQSYISRGYQ